jgi:hypothetical protein
MPRQYFSQALWQRVSTTIGCFFLGVVREGAYRRAPTLWRQFLSFHQTTSFLNASASSDLLAAVEWVRCMKHGTHADYVMSLSRFHPNLSRMMPTG